MDVSIGEEMIERSDFLHRGNTLSTSVTCRKRRRREDGTQDEDDYGESTGADEGE